MTTVKTFMNGESPAVCLPGEMSFADSEVCIQRLGNAVLIVPKDKVWDTFMEGVNGFTDDYFEAMEHRNDFEIQSSREEL